MGATISSASFILSPKAWKMITTVRTSSAVPTMKAITRYRIRAPCMPSPSPPPGMAPPCSSGSLVPSARTGLVGRRQLGQVPVVLLQLRRLLLGLLGEALAVERGGGVDGGPFGD